VDFDSVRQIGCAFPGVELCTSWGKPALKIGGQMFACIPTHRSAEPGTLVVRTDFNRRAELLEEAPDIYYLTDHNVGYPAVLVRLAKIRPDALRGLLAGAIRHIQTENRERKRAGGPASRPRTRRP
jgi:hypothetical protein